MPVSPWDNILYRIRIADNNTIFRKDRAADKCEESYADAGPSADSECSYNAYGKISAALHYTICMGIR